MDMVAPDEWGAVADYDGWSDRQVLKDQIAIHYGGGPIRHYPSTQAQEERQLRAWERYHMAPKPAGRGWRGIAYGYAIGATGTVYRLRGSNLYGAHLGDDDDDGIPNNSEVIPVLFIIGAGQYPTPEMWSSFRQLHRFLWEQPWTASTLPVRGHREIQPKPTACPGDIIMDEVEAQFREDEMLQKGDKGLAVKKVQEDLLSWDANSLPQFGADGDFGNETVEAIRRFQFDHGLPDTGTAGGVTVSILASYDPAPGGPPGPQGPPGATPDLEDYELRKK